MKRQKYDWLNEDSKKFLERGYLKKGQTPLERFKEIADTAEAILKIKGFSDKFLDFLSRGYYSIATPILMNFGNERGLGISCFNSHIEDSIEDFLIKQAEVGMMTKMGGGTSGYFGNVRPRGSEISSGGLAEGAVRCMELFYHVTSIVSQGSARRGHFAAYLPIDHGDFDEFMKIRSEGHTIQEMSIGVTIPDGWMQSMIDGDKEKRRRWANVLKKRSETGYPYVFFTDNVNNQKPQVYKDKNYVINASNMCEEIKLPSTKDESFVCCLSSLNLLWWDEIKETDAVETLVMFLDAVMSEFIEKTKDNSLMVAAHTFAKRHRALGMGVLGYHSYLQSKMIPWEGMAAQIENVSIFSEIRKRADAASEQLAVLFGEPEVLVGYGRRNTTTLAIAPTTSSSFILGQVSPSIEPLNSNYFVKDLAKGKFTYKNPYLIKLLQTKNKDDITVWKEILSHGGSVQHLKFLTQEEKDVFKTFGEISQKEIVIQAIQRQKFIDQGQSLNLMIPPNTKPKEVNELMIFGWQNGIKGFYYQRSSNPAQELARNILNCTTCEA
jgi:ribonucleoside-diphosphate reductase alpha chain